MRIDGEFKTRIIDDQSLIVGYSFSPDGAQIVFEGVFNDNYDIYIMNSNGTNRQRLTDWFEWDVNPVFTPDGMQIVYVSQIDSFVSFEELTNFDLFIMDTDGFEKQNLTNQLASCGKPIMSPDGKTIAFRMTVVNGIHNIYAINIDGSNIRQFTYDGGSHPLQFSPDGSNILFKSNRNVDDRIFIMDSNGDNQTQITSEGTRNYSAQYSSDGEKIVFTAHEQDGNSIWVMDSDGSNRNRVFIYDYLGSVPQFQPIH
jgi:TolB protein